MENLGRIYVTNLGLYNEGILAGTWVDLSEPENVDENKIYSDIKLDEHYTEYVITDYDGVFGEELKKAFGNYISISQMKAIALFFDRCINTEEDIDAFEAICIWNDNRWIDSVDMFDRGQYTWLEGITSDEDFGRYYWENHDKNVYTAYLERYIDFEDYGRCMKEGIKDVTTENGTLWVL